MSTPAIKPSKLLPCLLLAALPSLVHALASDVEKPLQIDADTATFDKKAGTAVYTGKVVVHQGSLEILAAEVHITAPENKIQLVVATGAPVNFKQQMDDGKQAVGHSNKMQYFVAEKRLLLDGDAELAQDQDKFSGNHIEYLPNTGQLNADGSGSKSGRVSATFYPTNKTDKGAENTGNGHKPKRVSTTLPAADAPAPASTDTPPAAEKATP